jgi:hypothetical protein
MAPVANSRLTSQDIGSAKVSAVITGVAASIKNMRTAGHPFRVLLSSFIQNLTFAVVAEISNCLFVSSLSSWRGCALFRDADRSGLSLARPPTKHY